jgi:hypothetical protein
VAHRLVAPVPAACSASIAYAIDRGYSIELARTIAMNTLVVMEIFHLFFIRNIHGTSLTWKAVSGTRWSGVTLFAIIETEKQIRLRLGAARQHRHGP